MSSASEIIATYIPIAKKKPSTKSEGFFFAVGMYIAMIPDADEYW